MADKPPIDREFAKRVIGQSEPCGQVGKSQVFQRCDPRFSNCRDINRLNPVILLFVSPFQGLINLLPDSRGGAR